MHSIYIAGGRKKNTAVNVMVKHLERLGHRVTRDSRDPEGWDVTVRWGVSFHEDKPALNAKVNKFDKLEALYRFANFGILAPHAIQDWYTLRKRDFPVLARNRHHVKGKDIVVCQTKVEAANIHRNKDFYVPWIPTDTEFRVWVFQNKALAVYEKQFKGEGEYEGFMRNRRFGFKFVKRDDLRDLPELVKPSIKAVEALEMDFGAVDVLRGKDGKYYVLEVNSMPAIDNVARSSGIRLAAHISQWAENQ